MTFVCGCCQLEGEIISNCHLLKCCNNYVHVKCMKQWETRRENEEDRPTCPYCRECVTPLKNPLPWIGPPDDSSDDVRNAVTDSDNEMIIDSDEETTREPAVVQNDEATRNALSERPIMTRDEIVARLRELLGSPELESRLREVSRFIPMITLQLRDTIDFIKLNEGIREIMLIVDCHDMSELYEFRPYFERFIEAIADKMAMLLLIPFYSNGHSRLIRMRDKIYWRHLKQGSTKDFSITASITNPSPFDPDEVRYWKIYPTLGVLPKNFITCFSSSDFFASHLD